MEGSKAMCLIVNPMCFTVNGGKGNCFHGLARKSLILLEGLVQRTWVFSQDPWVAYDEAHAEA